MWHAALWLGLQLYGWARLGKVRADNSRLSIGNSTSSGAVGRAKAWSGWDWSGWVRRGKAWATCSGYEIGNSFIPDATVHQIKQERNK